MTLLFTYRRGDADTVEDILRKHPALINVRNKRMQTPAHEAARFNRADILRDMLSRNSARDQEDDDVVVNLGLKDHLGRTPLAAALRNDCCQAVDAILSFTTGLPGEKSSDTLQLALGQPTVSIYDMCRSGSMLRSVQQILGDPEDKIAKHLNEKGDVVVIRQPSLYKPLLGLYADKMMAHVPSSLIGACLVNESLAGRFKKMSLSQNSAELTALSNRVRFDCEISCDKAQFHEDTALCRQMILSPTEHDAATEVSDLNQLFRWKLSLT